MPSLYSILETSANTILILNQPWFYGGIFLYWLTQKKFFIFLKNLHILSVSTCINITLKVLFKIPLMPQLGKGYAMPSGHMQAAFVFYGLIFLIQKLRIKSFCFLILIIGFSIIFKNYHTANDIICACCVGSIILSQHHHFNQYNTKKFILITLAMTMCCAYVLIEYPLYSHILIHLFLMIISGHFLKQLHLKSSSQTTVE